MTVEKLIFEQDLRGVSKDWLKGFENSAKGRESGRRERKNNNNPVSREIADTNFLETKIYSSKYIIAKT